MGIFGNLPNVYDEAFWKNSKHPKAVNYFCKKALSEMFDSVLSMSLWLV